MAEQQALLERLIEAAAPPNSGNIARIHKDTNILISLSPVST